MRILEVRDGFIRFESKEKITLSSFVLINDTLKSYIAQVIQIKRAGENSIGYAKILYLYNDSLIEYDKSLPSNDSEIKTFEINEINKTFEIKKPIVVGNFIDNEQNIIIDKNFFNKKVFVSIDSYTNNKTVVTNFANQFEKSLVIDTIGIFNDKYIAGKDFKLPLNVDALDFLFEDCLNDATSDSKSLIKEIFQDLAEYAKTVPFLPFGILKSIVDEMVEKSHVFKLLVLKNKLALFDRLGYFAKTRDEANNLDKIITSNNAVIDLSKLEPTFQNRYLSIILSHLEKQESTSQVFVLASNSLNKKNLKKILTGTCSTTFVTHSRFKYINEIKSMFTNFIIEPTFANNETFKIYSTILGSMPKDSYLIVGEGTNYIPLVSSVIELKQDNKPVPEVINLEEELNDLEDSAITTSLEESDINTTEKDSSIVAIEKKSEDLINKVTEEVQLEVNSENLNLFIEEEEEEEEENLETNDNIDLVEQDLQQELSQETVQEEIIEINEEITEESLLEENIENSELESIEEFEATSLKESSTESLEKNNNIAETEIAAAKEEEENNDKIEEDYHTQIDSIQTIEIPDEISELTEEIENSDVGLIEGEVTELEEIQEDTEIKEYISNEEFTQEPPSIIPIAEDNELFEEIVELDESELSEDTIIVEFDEDNVENLDSEELDKEIVEDVDKVFTTIKEDSISDSDLDFIDELNNSVEEEVEEVVLSEGMEELTELEEFSNSDDELQESMEIQDYVTEQEPEKEILETKSTTTPIVPVYNADIPQEDIVMSDPIEQGDVVVHAKYGNGVVEKMIKYGTKTLYSINFDNVGRRLLDPTLTEIKKS